MQQTAAEQTADHVVDSSRADCRLCSRMVNSRCRLYNSIMLVDGGSSMVLADSAVGKEADSGG
jgi:hypothetical protein